MVERIYVIKIQDFQMSTSFFWSAFSLELKEYIVHIIFEIFILFCKVDKVVDKCWPTDNFVSPQNHFFT